MNVNKVIFLFIFSISIIPQVFAEENKLHLSFSPSLTSGVMGVTDYSFSPLTYNGPTVGLGLDFMAQEEKAKLFVNAAASYGWPGNAYHRNPDTMRNIQVNWSCGVLASAYKNELFLLQIGGAIGSVINQYSNLLFNRVDSMLAFDVDLCIYGEYKLNRKWFALIEERAPLASCILSSNKYMDHMPIPNNETTFKLLPGNFLKAGVAWMTNKGDCITLSIKHMLYYTSQNLSYGVRLQSLELCVNFRFSFN